MLIVIGLIVLLIIGIIFLIRTSRAECYFYCGFTLTTICSTLIFISIVSICMVQINKDIDYQNKLEERQMLEYRISKQDKISGNELLYSQIVEFNNDLRHNKKWANNIWTNCFFNKDIANNIDYIKIDNK